MIKELKMLTNLILASLFCLGFAVVGGGVIFKFHVDLWSGEDE